MGQSPDLEGNLISMYVDFTLNKFSTEFIWHPETLYVVLYRLKADVFKKIYPLALIPQTRTLRISKTNKYFYTLMASNTSKNKPATTGKIQSGIANRLFLFCFRSVDVSNGFHDTVPLFD